MDQDELITPSQAAQRKGVSRTTIYSAIQRGALPHSLVLGRIALRVSDVDAFQPATYGENQRASKPRGPGRPRRAAGQEQE